MEDNTERVVQTLGGESHAMLALHGSQDLKADWKVDAAARPPSVALETVTRGHVSYRRQHPRRLGMQCPSQVVHKAKVYKDCIIYAVALTIDSKP